jgi:hypothetical protein
MRWTRLPISGGNNDEKSYFVDALKAGARFGVIASSDDHATLPGAVHHHRVLPFRPLSLNGFAHKGLAAIRAPELNREALFEAMKNRSTYATTSTRSIIDFNIDEALMGQEIKADNTLRKKRSIRIRFTLEHAAMARIIMMRNGEQTDMTVLKGSEVSSRINEIIFEDETDLDKIAITNARYHPDPFVVYYVRIEDNHGFHYWTSPIWIDI